MITAILSLVWLHFFADFILQSRNVATSKGSDMLILTWHVFLYSIPFWIFFGFWFALLNGLLHWLTDFFSSKVTTYAWKKNNMTMFFIVIGLDQSIHLTCLFLSYKYLFLKG